MDGEVRVADGLREAGEVPPIPADKDHQYRGREAQSAPQDQGQEAQSETGLVQEERVRQVVVDLQCLCVEVFRRGEGAQ